MRYLFCFVFLFIQKRVIFRSVVFVSVYVLLFTICFIFIEHQHELRKFHVFGEAASRHQNGIRMFMRQEHGTSVRSAVSTTMSQYPKYVQLDSEEVIQLLLFFLCKINLLINCIYTV